MFSLLAMLLPPEPPATNVVYGPIYHIERSIELPEPLESPLAAAEIEVEEVPELTVLTSCVLYLQFVKQLKISGDAITQVPNKSLEEVEVGDVLIMNYKGVGHVSYVEHRFPKAVLITETNFKKGKFTERAITFDDPAIVGAMSVEKKVIALNLAFTE